MPKQSLLNWWSLAIIWFLLATGLGSCNLPVGQSASENLVTPTPSSRAGAPPPNETPTSLPSPRPDASGPLCLPFKEGVSLAKVTFAETPQAILDFLNAGGSIAALDEALYQAYIANQPVAVGAIDLTGEGKQDVVVSIFDPASSLLPPGGKLLIYVCQEGVYRLLHHQASSQGMGAPGIRYLQDLNLDGRAELVTSSPTCGASTCFEEVQILGWTGTGFENLLSGSTVEIPAPVINVLEPQGDGIFELEIAGGGFGSVGAGPQRSLSTVWTYNPTTTRWQDPQERLESSNYRIHVLQDADQAALERQFEQALLDYGRVVDDASLIDWNEPEIERPNLSAYALFKIAVAHLLLAQPDLAQAAFDRQRADFPLGALGHAYVELASVFQEAYPAGGLPNGCAAARKYAAEHPQEILVPLGSALFGYANPDYSPQDICPWE
jgi:hypothetical protein